MIFRMPKAIANVVIPVKCSYGKLSMCKLKQMFDFSNKFPKMSAMSSSTAASRARNGLAGKRSAHHRGGMTESMEDYLESIADIVAEQGFVRVSDVAERLEIRRASVSIMIKRLSELGYLNHVPYRGFTLTPSGRAVASRVKARHETLAEFFELLHLPPGTRAKDVEGIEHHISGETLELLRSFIRFWRAHPSVAQDYSRHLGGERRKNGG